MTNKGSGKRNVNDLNAVILEEYLERLGMFKDWKTRFIELTPHSLRYCRIKGKSGYIYNL
jgi:hypothetical protein